MDGPMSIHDMTNRFTWFDYVMMIAVLASSSLIGIYFAWKDRKKMNNKQFLMANRQLGAFPVSMSLMASFQSATTYLGYPSEMFYRGTQYWAAIFGLAISNLIAGEFFLPVLYDLKLTSVNSYLEYRFNRWVRVLGAVSFTCNNLLYMGVVLYGPSLALKPVVGLPLWTSIVGLGLLCTFYTTLGGVKAVVWTDVMQMSIAVLGMVALSIVGIIKAGGLSEVFRIANEGGRLQFFNTQWDPSSGTVLWNVLIGTTMVWLGSYGTSQTEVQRFCSVSTLKKARLALYCNIPGVMFNISLGCLAGLVIYANYYDCDPLQARRIDSPDQLMPYFVMEVLGGIPGLPGLFVAVIFSAALSTLSSGFNSLAAVAYEDFLQFAKLPLPPIVVTKTAAATYGFLTVGLAFLAGSIGNLIKAAFAMSGALSGPLLAVFALGMFLPHVNGKSALLGLLVGQAVCLYIVSSAVSSDDGQKLTTSIDGCTTPTLNSASTVLMNATTVSTETSGPWPPSQRAATKISHLLVPISGFSVTFIVALLSILVFGTNDPRSVNPNLLSKYVRKYLRRVETTIGAATKDVPSSERNTSYKTGDTQL
ncbi:sodium-coupled monocarboxylate transporter 1-like isoform X1 [Varroa destructor]|uniref:Sodium/solute symporter n=2 Tax=Varroa destructor TaxID=109461 RepID=A0A7M7KXD7_VARDE|nr:sodium-coupled monocarboxylate transporter 1-like isoform X1 [Varroa destructor]XP_022673444.1 sodium-coupled monocarboxylate transporter 1-like isoform X1 [Varroa destructor]XP_022673445.1 sodium-coupled monocarboxylate transporter 1-like isoform X1 [Varroa destructor]